MHSIFHIDYMFEEEHCARYNQTDSRSRNIKALCLWICVSVKRLVHEASFIKVNYTLTLSHCKHSPSVSFSLPSPLSLSLFFTNTPSLLGGPFGSALPSVWCVFWEFQGVVLCLCVLASLFRSSPSSEPHLPPWTHSLRGSALWLVVWRRRHSPSSTPSSFVS